MRLLKIQIVAFVRNDQPGWVEGRLVDANDHCHTFVEKVPVIAIADLDSNSPYPQPGVIGCEIIDQWKDDQGRTIVRISTKAPWGIESSEGLDEFVVFASQLEDDQTPNTLLG